MFYHFKNPPQFCVFSFLYDRPYTLSKGSHFTATEMHYFQKRSLVSTDLFMSHSSHFVRKESGVVRSNKWMLKGEKVVRSQQEMYMYFFVSKLRFSTLIPHGGTFTHNLSGDLFGAAAVRLRGCRAAPNS